MVKVYGYAGPLFNLLFETFDSGTGEEQRIEIFLSDVEISTGRGETVLLGVFYGKAPFNKALLSLGFLFFGQDFTKSFHPRSIT